MQLACAEYQYTVEQYSVDNTRKYDILLLTVFCQQLWRFGNTRTAYRYVDGVYIAFAIPEHQIAWPGYEVLYDVTCRDRNTQCALFVLEAGFDRDIGTIW